MPFPNQGQQVSASQTGQMVRQSPKKQLNATSLKPNKFLGGGGMAVGTMRNAKGQHLHPANARTALIAALRG